MPPPRVITATIDGEVLTATFSGREQREALRLLSRLPADEAEKVARLMLEIKARFDARLESDEELYAPPPTRARRPPRKRKEWIP